MKMTRLWKPLLLALVLAALALALSGCIVDPDKNIGGANIGGYKTYTSPPPVVNPTTLVVTPTPEPGTQAWGGTGNATARPGGIATPTVGVVTQIPAVTPTVTVTPSVYKLGVSGDTVRTIQTALKRLGYYKGSVDGDFGANTEAAVKAFQSQNGLKADGVVGNATLSKLNSNSAATAKPAATATPRATSVPDVSDNTYLSNGNSGSKVTQMQTRLIELGYMLGSASGKFCDITEQAVISFQNRNSLDNDGVAGPSTLRKLYSSSARSTSSALGVIGITLKSGDEGAAVRLLQTKLRTFGFYTGTVDGSYGEKTLNAVKDFQASNGLKSDGKAGAGTLQKLFAGSVSSSSGSGSNDKDKDKDKDDSGIIEGAYIKVTAAPKDSNGNAVYITLEKGHMGDPVKKLQRALKNAGYYSGSVDGYYGEDTVTAVKSYQRAKGLVQDGKAGAATQRYLYEGNYPDQS